MFAITNPNKPSGFVFVNKKEQNFSRIIFTIDPEQEGSDY
jgi:hypothetical protein